MSAPDQVAHDPMCMGCGPANPSNLGVEAWLDEDRVRGTVPLDDRHAGAPGFAHGGAIAAIMDDLLGSVLLLVDRPAVTASLTVDFKAPALLGRDLVLEAWCEGIDGRKLDLRGEARQDGVLVAEARALFLQVDVSHWEASGRPLPAGWDTWGAETGS
jgi:acyl-coenzyme A thioesterase PaaI-like protein